MLRLFVIKVLVFSLLLCFIPFFLLLEELTYAIYTHEVTIIPKQHRRLKKCNWFVFNILEISPLILTHRIYSETQRWNYSISIRIIRLGQLLWCFWQFIYSLESDTRMASVCMMMKMKWQPHKPHWWQLWLIHPISFQIIHQEMCISKIRQFVDIQQRNLQL